MSTSYTAPPPQHPPLHDRKILISLSPMSHHKTVLRRPTSLLEYGLGLFVCTRWSRCCLIGTPRDVLYKTDERLCGTF